MSEEIVDTETTDEDFGSWEGVLVVTGAFTGDRRFIDDGALSHRDLPLPLMAQFQNPEFGGHAGAVIAANIERIWVDGSTVYGAGRFDRGEDGQKARQLIKDGMFRGISVDLDSVSGELGEDSDGEFLRITSARIMGATLTSFPAFAEAGITIVASGAEMNEDGTVTISAESTFNIVDVSNPGDALDVEALVASGRMSVSLNAAPIEPPSFWFDKPTFKTVQPVTVDKSGRVFGHVAAWGSCHISFKDCRDVPKCGTYKKFMNKTVLCDDGVLRPSGVVFINTNHANTRVNADVAADHYADTGAAVADVAVYEDEFGLVIAGAVRPDATPEAVRVFRGSDISPDWRKVRSMKNKAGKWELVGLLSVNTSGFVVDSLLASGETLEEVKPAAGIVDGEIVSLVASGMVSRQLTVEDRLADLESMFKDIDDLKTALVELKGSTINEFNESEVTVSDIIDSNNDVSDQKVSDSVDENALAAVAARFGYLTSMQKLEQEHAELLSKFKK